MRHSMSLKEQLLCLHLPSDYVPSAFFPTAAVAPSTSIQQLGTHLQRKVTPATRAAELWPVQPNQRL